MRLDEVPGGKYPFRVPAVRGLVSAGELRFDTPVTLIAGGNGSGKSTLIEGIAVAAGFNPEGGSTSFNFATRPSESSLGEHLTLVRTAGRKPRTGFFLRAESYYNVATEIERLDENGFDSYGGVSPHHRSHGESFLDLATHRFGPGGLYLLDEPEAALSVQGCLALLVRMADLVESGSQFIIATHSPILLASPGATILEIDPAGTIDRVPFDRAEAVVMTRAFLADPNRFLTKLMAG
ncbi:AAA family ATPase [Actinoplanes couchii]|uniref:AAA+ ATPase domain-containing protein n=2 Tax=Actinoplanes couchii TaxID=403638 RepID=A0ABQ3X8T4_9ACTN|nr:hypothetical protein Aco03nite_033270 [Actinoplanes couchii]